MEKINLFLILLGALYFSYAIWYYIKITKKTKDLSMRFWWSVLFTFTIFFLIAYVAVGYSTITKGSFFNSELFTSIILLFGSIFVLISARVFYIVVNALQKAQKILKDQNKNLEKLVKRRTQKLETLYKKSLSHEKKIQKLKDEFVFIAAHELRSPVNAIRWNLDVIKDSKTIKKLSKADRELLDDVETSNKRLIALVDDLLNVARIEYGGFKIKTEKISMKDAATSAIKEIKILTKEKNISIIDKINKDLPRILADSIRTKEILINLLSNAIKYNKKKGKITIETVSNKTHVTTTVTDTGIGITKKELDKLFTKFYRAENEAVRNITGTGLGLYITKQMVEKMNGKIWAESKGKDKGTKFSFTLPVSKK